MIAFACLALATPDRYLAPIVAEMEKKWPSNRMVEIACHGHSVPAGYFVTPNVATFDAYPHLLHEGLKRRFPFAVVNVMVTAIGGENSVSGAARFARDVLSRHPDVVTIDYGLNDRGVGLEKARVAWVSMIEQAKRAGVRVLLVTPTGDQGAKMTDPSDPLAQHADQIRALAASYDVGLVDAFPLVRSAAERGVMASLMSQVNHPSRASHALVAEALLAWFPATTGGH